MDFKRRIGWLGFGVLVVLGVATIIFMKQSAEAAGGTAVYLPALTNDYYRPDEQSVFGVQMYGNTSTESDYHPYLIDSRASWLRINLSWSSIEPNNVDPNAYNWSSTDKSLAAARTDMGNINIIANIETNPTWAADEENGPIHPDDVGEFAQMMGALVERYDGDGIDDAPGSPVVTYWEIYNEPDRSLAPPRWGNDGLRYAQMLQAIYPLIKAANPEAQVVFGGIAYDWFEEEDGPFNRAFLNDVLAADGGNYFDVMNFHSYPSFAHNWTGIEGSTGVIGKANAIRSVMAQYNVSKPIMITEAGFHDNNVVGAPSSPEIQSRYLVTLFTESVAADIDVMIWWLLYDVGGFYPYNNGLVTNQINPIQEKQSFAVYQNLVDDLLYAEFEATLPNAVTGTSEAVVHRFRDDVNGRTFYVTWHHVVTTNNSVLVKIPANSVTVRDSVTNSISQVLDSADGTVDGKVTLAVDGRPLIVEVNN